MTDNPYDILGVKPETSDKEIKAAYRKLAKDLHPDLNPGDTKAEERFKAVTAAYNFLSDKELRAKFDRGEIDASGMEKPQNPYYRSYAGAGPDHAYHSTRGFSDFGNESDLFSEIFGRQRAGHSARAHGPIKGPDTHYHLSVSFLDAVLGAKKRVTMPDGTNLDVTVPAGISEGQTLRLKGKGLPGIGNGPSGDALVRIEVGKHPDFHRDNNDILLELPITLDEAVLGGKATIPTIHGNITANLPKGASSGQILRLKGKGIQPIKGSAGNQLVTLKVVMPKEIDEELKQFITSWREKNAYSVRQKSEGAS